MSVRLWRKNGEVVGVYRVSVWRVLGSEMCVVVFVILRTRICVYGGGTGGGVVVGEGGGELVCFWCIEVLLLIIS